MRFSMPVCVLSTFAVMARHVVQYEFRLPLVFFFAVSCMCLIVSLISAPENTRTEAYVVS